MWEGRGAHLDAVVASGRAWVLRGRRLCAGGPEAEVKKSKSLKVLNLPKFVHFWNFYSGWSGASEFSAQIRPRPVS
jgi:hypothetical protein